MAIAGALGAATVVLPAAAGSEGATPVVTAENVGLYSHYWTPAGVKVDPGATVEFSNPTEVPHGIRWVSTPAGAPECAGVPVGTTASASGEKWKGACTVAAAGTYTYYCTVHGASMSGTITVGTPTTGTTGTTTGATTTTGTTPTGTTTTGSGTTPSEGGGAAGAISDARLAFARRSGAVRGSVEVDSSAAGGTLTVVLSAKIAGSNVKLARLTRAYVSEGVQSWTLKLTPRALRTLHAKRRLLLRVRIAMTPPGGSASVLTRTLTLRG